MSGKWAASYGWIALLVVATGCINVLTSAQRAGSANWSSLRASILDETTSALVIICLLPLLKRSVDTLSPARDRRIAFIAIAMAMIAYGLLHIAFMVGLRQLAYAPFGGYAFHWQSQFLIEFRKDLISAFMIVVLFWLFDRKSHAAAPVLSDAPSDAPSPTIWLRDGTSSIRVEPAQIVSVTSAGNYVEFALSAQRHLIRGTLSGEEVRLKPFGFVRIHRTRLVNASRIIAIETRPNGDFVVKMDTGDTVAGSRRYKAALAEIRRAGDTGIGGQ